MLDSRILNWLAAASLCVLVAGCNSVPHQTSAQEVLRIGVAPDYEPLVFEREGQVVGIEADLAARVSAGLSRPMRFVRLSWPELLPALREDRIDVIMAGMSITPERSRQVCFTKPYLEVGQMALVRLADLGRIPDLETLDAPDLEVGFVRGTTGAEWAQSELRRATGVVFENAEAGVAALRDGRITAFVHDAPTIWRVGGKPGEQELVGLYQPRSLERLAWAVRATDKELCNSLSAQLTQMERSGVLQRILDKWITLRIEVR